MLLKVEYFTEYQHIIYCCTGGDNFTHNPNSNDERDFPTSQHDFTICKCNITNTCQHDFTICKCNITNTCPTSRAKINMTTPGPINMTSPSSTPAPEPKVTLEFKLNKNFTPELSNPSSPEFLALKADVSKALDSVYSTQFGSSFNRTVINGFSPGSIVVDAELIFNKGSPPPNGSSVAGTLTDAVNSGGISLPVNEVGKKLYDTSFLRSIVNAFTNGSVVVNMTLVFKDNDSVPALNNAVSQFSTELGKSDTLNVIPDSVQIITSSSPPQPLMGSLAVFSLTLLAVAQMLIGI
ncbi:hypothetical protein INR49_014387 [Caranx melampygus]|nr:hypothetical protein INR49_014387 [Caranx melampygus]